MVLIAVSNDSHSTRRPCNHLGSLQLSLGELVMKTTRSSCVRLFLLALFVGSNIPLAGCGSSSNSTTEFGLTDEQKAELKANKDKTKAERKLLKSKNIKTH
jgi:hypothetical protein